MTNDETRMTNETRSPNDEGSRPFRVWSFVIHSDFGLRQAVPLGRSLAHHFAAGGFAGSGTRSPRRSVPGRIWLWMFKPAIRHVLPVSATSPMGEALMKSRVGETIKVKAPRGTMEFKILEIL